MHLAARFSIALLLVLPLFASADGFVGLVVQTGVNKTLCPAGSAGDPTAPAKIFDITSGASAIRGYVQRTLLCPSACFNENIVFSVVNQQATKISVKVTGYSKCTKTDADPNAEDAKKDNRGCGAKQIPPNVTVRVPSIGFTGAQAMPAKTIGPKSRCDAAVSNAVDAILGNLSYNNIVAAQTSVATLDSLPQVPLLGAVTGNDALLASFMAAGVSEEDAKAAIQKNPIEAVNYINAINAGNQADLNKSAAVLGLNADITDEQQREVMKISREASGAVDLPDEGTVREPGQKDTFGAGEVTELDKARCAISKNESGSCGGNYSTVGPWTPKGRAYGRYQVMDFNIPSWTRQACGQSLTPQQYLNDRACQDKVFDTVFGGYMAQCGFAGAASRWFSGKCAVGSGNDGYTSIPRYVAKALATFNGSSFPFGAQAAPYRSGGSPFASANPFGPSYEDRVVCTGYGQCYLSNTSYPGPVSTGYPVSTGAPVSTGGTVSTQAPVTPVSQLLGQTGTGVTTGAAPVPAGVATLLAQPQSVKRGSTVTVSWSSVGMRTDQLCQLFADNTFMAQGNEGSRLFDTKSVATSTSVTFTLQCFSKANVKVQKTSTVTVS